MKNFNASNSNVGTLKYKAVTTPDGKTDIEFVFDMNISTATPVHQVWYDMGNGAHISSESLDRMTRPYNHKTEAELEHETEPYT